MQRGFVHTFRNLSHSNLHAKVLIPTFIKATWQVYKSMDVKQLSPEKFQTLIKPLAYILFTLSKDEIEPVLINIHKKFKNPQEIKFFFNNTFYIILNIYIKSLYGTTSQLDQIRILVNAMEDFILYALDIYSHNQDADEQQLDLAALFEKLQANDIAITVLNTYYGVPIQNEGKILQTDAQSILLQVPSVQMTAATYEKKIHILKGDDLPHDLYAKVTTHYLNGEHVLKLHQFEYLKKDLYQRKEVRVHPLKKFTLDVMHDNELFKFGLYDVSLGGIAITSKSKFNFKNNSVTLYFPEEIISYDGEIKASVITVSLLDENKLYHAKIDLTTQQEFYLSKYIKSQERAIIKMLRDEIV
jgi:hypothetical protein